MPQVPTTPTDNKAPAPAPKSPPAPPGSKPLLPPEEQFWQRYSPHHEFQVSSGTSFALHFIIIGLMVVVGIVWLSSGEKKPDAIQVGTTTGPEEPEVVKVTGQDVKTGGGGGRHGTDIANPQKGESPDKGQEDIGQGGPDDKTILSDPPEPPKAEIPAQNQGSRTIAQGTGVPRDLSGISEDAYKTLKRATQGKGSKGSGGGSGGGTDTGKGPGRDKGVGPGSGGDPQRLRAERQVRWRIIFNKTTDGSDYRDKLRAMGAILVVAQAQRGRLNSQGRAILSYPFAIYPQDIKRNAKLTRVTAADIKKINRIFWIDDKPQSVRALADALGIPPPPLFACFFPEKVEQECRDLERARYKGAESNIRETIFHVDMEGNSYHLTCDRVILK